MRTMRPGVAWLGGLVAAVLAAAPQAHAQQQDPYSATMQFGTGLITIPVAWVSPTNLDAWITASARNTPTFPNSAVAQGIPSRLNTNIAIDMHFMGRVSVGIAAYDQNVSYGVFGQALVLRDNQFGFLPGVAVGVRNLGNCKTEDRMLLGCDTGLQGDSTYRRSEVGRYRNFKTRPTVYAVATKGVSFGSPTSTLGAGSASFSVGYGNGLFSEDGAGPCPAFSDCMTPQQYNAKGTIAKGLFLGGRVAMHPTLNTTVSVLAENDGWDYNAGVVADYRGISLGVFGTELEEGGRTSAAEGLDLYNYTKLNVMLGYSGNVLDIARGVLLRTRITELTREQERLRLEIDARERRIRGLELALRRAQAGELADIARQRAQLESEVQAERDAIRRANERLRELETGRPTTPPTTPPPTPPSTLAPANSPTTPSAR